MKNIALVSTNQITYIFCVLAIIRTISIHWYLNQFSEKCLVKSKFKFNLFYVSLLRVCQTVFEVF